MFEYVTKDRHPGVFVTRKQHRYQDAWDIVGLALDYHESCGIPLRDMEQMWKTFGVVWCENWEGVSNVNLDQLREWEREPVFREANLC